MKPKNAPVIAGLAGFALASPVSWWCSASSNVAGPATFGTTGQPRSRVVAFSTLTGAQVASYETKGENVLAEDANLSIAFEGSGRLYMLNTQLGMYRLTPATGKQEPYGDPFPDLPPCVLSPAPCSPAPSPTPPLPNDLAFNDAGNAYVTDAMQATIWRVPAGGGAPQIWFQDSRLTSAYIGVTVRANCPTASPSGPRASSTWPTPRPGLRMCRYWRPTATRRRASPTRSGAR